MGFTKDNLRIYLQLPFILCTIVLAVSVGGMSVAIDRLGGYLQKEPTPLIKSLDDIDEKKFLPYKVIAKEKIQIPEIVKELGTEDYIQWLLEDPSQPNESAISRVMLFITYYRLPDRVPHVPEECYAGSGFQRLASDSVTFKIDRNGDIEEIPGKYLVFGRATENFWQSRAKFPVLYTFKVNGEYAGSRDDARVVLNKNIFGKHSYFCKIELVFSRTSVAPEKEEALKASSKILTVLLPILENEHWPEIQGR